MSTRKLPLLFVALFIAAMTVFLARSMMNEPIDPAAPVEVKAPPTYEILVSAKDLPSGTLLTEADVKWKIWPKEEGKEGEASEFVVKGEADVKSVVGNVVRYGIRAGEPITPARTVKPGEQGFMAAALAPGMRAVSIAITPVAGVAGFIFPGDRVDVIVTHQVGRKSEADTTERRVSETMLSDVRVLALDQKMSDQVTEPKVAQIATLEVTPKQAEKLALVSELGTVSLALRSIANDAAKTTADAQEGKDLAQEALANVIANSLAQETGHEITWDSDISKVLPRPANRSGAVQKILIIRGKDVSEAIFDLQQP